MTVDAITQSQNGNENATEALIKKFAPLLKKYSHLLSYEDAYDDLLVDFIQLIHDMNVTRIQNHSEGCLVSYISNAMRSAYIKRSKQMKSLRNIVLNSELNDKQLYCLEFLLSKEDTYFEYEFPDIERILTKQEASVIQKICIYGYSACRTANMLGVSRQAVNQMKNRALKKLKTQFVDKP